jgi:hypothetical protein
VRLSVLTVRDEKEKKGEKRREPFTMRAKKEKKERIKLHVRCT